MKEIPLTRGMVAMVDDDDYELVAGRKWTVSINRAGNCYAISHVRRGLPNIRMHRLILGARQGEMVDHKDGNGLNNTRENIRLCTAGDNQHNRGPHPRNKSGYKGVSWDEGRGKWFVKIRLEYQQIFLTYTDNCFDGAYIYDQAAMQLHGDFARLNVL